MALKNSKILKVAGLSFVGFCAVSIGVDKANVGPVAQQLAGFCGAFIGGWVGARKRDRSSGDKISGVDEPVQAKASTSSDSSE